MRHLLLDQSQTDPYIEEGLAVSYSRLRIAKDRANGRKRMGKMRNVLFNFLWKETYAYQSPGYKDYPKYQDKEKPFVDGLMAYMTQGRQSILDGVLPEINFEFCARNWIDW
jgi:hypothetical protein